MAAMTARAKAWLWAGVQLAALAALLGGAAPAPARAGEADFPPDPRAVQRCGPAWRYPQAGWTVLHIEGEPYERGYQYGQLLAPEIADYVKALAAYRSPKAPADGWSSMRMLVNALFLRRYDREYLEEMKGIADGAAAAGAKFEGRALDLNDVVAINSSIEIDFLDSGLEATPTGLEGLRFKEPSYARPKKLPPAHCSAFVATGPATADGGIVFGHITMWNLFHVRHFNVWLDVKPARGHRVLMQTFPGGIMSGMDYYLNDAGLLVAETTIKQTKFDVTGWSLCARIRKALQYGQSIDEAVAYLQKDNNGLYSNEWLLADVKTNEIAMFELGTHKSKLWRSGRDEWLGGTKGFYWGCNNAKDLDVRIETYPSLEGKPANLVFAPSDRDKTWQRLYEKHKGKITAEFGFEAFTTPPLAAFPSCDAKFTTSALAKQLKTWALFGPPLGRTWEPTADERAKYDDIRPLVSNDWTLLTGQAPEGGSPAVAVDLQAGTDTGAMTEAPGAEHTAGLPAAWRGSVLPKRPADTWLAAAFAEYEGLAALEKSLRDKKGELSDEARERLAVALFAYRSRWTTAARRLGRDVPLAETQPDFKRDEWYDIALGKGVLLLHELRSRLGAERFDRMMDEFGSANAGKAVTVEEFRSRAERAAGAALNDLFDPWLKGAPGEGPPPAWSVYSFEDDPDQALIVYGTKADRAANREAARLLQAKIARRWGNYTVPIKADTEVTPEELAGRHLLLVGRPEANGVTAGVKAWPVRLGRRSFEVKDKVYANASSAVIAVAPNPQNDRYSAVLFAGLSAEATWRCVQRLPNGGGRACEVVVFAAGHDPEALVVSPADRVAARPAAK